MSNARFAEYATSGAFTLSLSRNQISALSLIVAGGSDWFSNSASTLERKGLIEPVAAPEEHAPDKIEYRATLAGLLCQQLIQQAGLTNQGGDAVESELAALRAEVENRRRDAVDARQAGRSAMARMEKAERETNELLARLAKAEARLASCEAQRSYPRLKPEFAASAFEACPMISLRDPLPERSNADLSAALQDPPA